MVMIIHWLTSRKKRKEMSACGKLKDNAACMTTAINLGGGLLAIVRDAVDFVYDINNPTIITGLTVKDKKGTGVYPISSNENYPVKMEWLHNSVNPNYEVVEGTNSVTYTQSIGTVVITDSETKEGKANILALTGKLFVVVSKMRGANADSAFHVFGMANGLKFMVEPATPESGNRVIGKFTSLEGAGEITPNGVNLLIVNAATTESLFNNRFEVV